MAKPPTGRHRIVVRGTSTVPEESSDQSPAGDRAGNGNRNGQPELGMGCPPFRIMDYPEAAISAIVVSL